MIHQLIFAGPKPGLSAEAFQSYWLNFHAVDYAAKIKQIRRYLVAPRVPGTYSREVPFFQGVAEIWLKDDKEQIASMQSPEFLQGARIDEPRWAAFWATFVHDADSEILKPAQFREEGYHKLYVFLKRRRDLDLEEFRRQLLDVHGRTALSVNGLAGYVAAFARPGAYGLGEPRFDAIEVYSFDRAGDAQNALIEPTSGALEQSWNRFCLPECLFTFFGHEHWVIPPGQRDG